MLPREGRALAEPLFPSSHPGGPRILLLTIVVITIIFPVMPGRPRKRVKPAKPFRRLEEEVFVTLQRTADRLLRQVEAALRPFALSPAQYNVLRILRGAGAQGLACREIGERMVTRDPDITRLLDRMETRGWVVRSREKRDRRIITTRVTKEGLRLLETLDKPVTRTHVQQLRHVGERKLRSLIKVLDQVQKTQ